MEHPDTDRIAIANTPTRFFNQSPKCSKIDSVFEPTRSYMGFQDEEVRTRSLGQHGRQSPLRIKPKQGHKTPSSLLVDPNSSVGPGR